MTSDGWEIVREKLNTTKNKIFPFRIFKQMGKKCLKKRSLSKKKANS